VTGAARGIGRAIANHLHDLGSQVIGLDIDPAVTRDAPWHGVVGDVTEPAVQQACIDTATSSHGPPTILVNCAFAEERALLAESTDAGWEHTLGVSLLAPVGLSRCFVRALDTRPGSIVNVASVHAFRALPGFGAYAAAKAGLLAATRSAAVEWGPLGVRVNAVAPGFIAVERNAAIWTDDGALSSVVDGYPLRRAGRPEEVARCVAFLADDSAGFITGSCLDANGGQYMA